MPHETSLLIEDYAMIGDGQTCALVGINGSIDWLCWPRFDSGACFASLLGKKQNGHWQISPVKQDDGEWAVTRSYRGNTLILETIFTSSDGTEVALIDFMPIGEKSSSVVRIVEARKGRSTVESRIRLRFDYGQSIPWVTRIPSDKYHYAINAIAGPAQCTLRSTVDLIGENYSTFSLFSLEEGESECFVLSYSESHLDIATEFDAIQAMEMTEKTWLRWIRRCTYHGLYEKEVVRSLITLKAMIYAPTGGIVAAPTTSLPEQLGGARNWDYRYCWVRDSTLTLIAMMRCGYLKEAQQWRDWFRRAIAGTASQTQIMYGLGGERHLMEWEIPWLSGYENSKPVRVGNGAVNQLQLDVAGEMAMVLHLSRRTGLRPPEEDWNGEVHLLSYLEHMWQKADESMWEIRGPRKHFTFSKVSCWVAFDRGIKDAQTYGFEAPIKRWIQIKNKIHELVCEEGFCKEKNSFVQFFGSKELDATLLLLPVMGFLPIEDSRIIGTIEAIEAELMHEGFVQRYLPETNVDGLGGEDEGTFLACSCWLVDVYIMQGRMEEAHELFKRVLSIANDVGLLAEEYDVKNKRLVGNFPQAFSHLALINTALHLDAGKVPKIDNAL